MSINVCCPYLVVIDCVDTDGHKHIGCRACIDEGTGLTNDVARDWCLGQFEECPNRPKGEDGELVE